MKSYSVILSYETAIDVDVEADDEEQACEKARILVEEAEENEAVRYQDALYDGLELCEIQAEERR